MITTTFSEALAAWRLAERRWEVARVDDPEFRALGIEVVSTWLRYHELMDREPGSFVLVADDDHAYVAVSDGVTAVLGYEPRDVIGRRIEDISPPDLAAGTPIAWGRFLADGRQDGRYRLDRPRRTPGAGAIPGASAPSDPRVPHVPPLARRARAVAPGRRDRAPATKGKAI